MQNNIKTSLIISTYNWPQALNLCLLSVKAQKVLPDEVIIADDGSADDTRLLVEELKKDFPIPLKYVWQPHNGFQLAKIRNKAIAESAFEYIIQIDGDVVLDKNFIGDHLKSAEPRAFIRGRRALLTQDKTAQVLAAANTGLSFFSKGVKHRRHAMRLYLLRAFGRRAVMSPNNIIGSNFSFWRADFTLVNGYNNDIEGWGYETEELAARFINTFVIKKIVKLCAVQYHLHHAAADKDNLPKQRELVEKVKRDKIQFCANGYRQASI